MNAHVIPALMFLAAASASASVASGDAAMRDSKFRDAIKEYETHLKENPKDGDVIVKNALACEGLKWWGRAVQWWERYIAMFPDGERVGDAKKRAAMNHRRIGVNFHNLGESAGKAIAELKQAIVLDPELTDAYVWLGRIHDKEGQLARAIEIYQEGLRVVPDDCLLKWLVKDAQGKLEHGPAAFERFQQGIVLFEKGRKSDALTLFQSAAESNPDYADAHLWAARILFDLGRFAESIPEWEAVLRIEHGNARAVWFLKQAKIKTASQQKKQKK